MSDQGDQRDHIEEMAEHKSERTQQLEEGLREELGAMSYPVETSDVQAAYADGRIDVPNETEALAVAFDRLTDDATYDTEEEVREELIGEITGQAGRERGDMNEYNPQRDLEEIDEQERAGVGDGPTGERAREEGTREEGAHDEGMHEVADREGTEPEDRDDEVWIEGHEEDLVEESELDRRENDERDRMESDEPE